MTRLVHDRIQFFGHDRTQGHDPTNNFGNDRNGSVN
jgi:hypothetical protein